MGFLAHPMGCNPWDGSTSHGLMGNRRGGGDFARTTLSRYGCRRSGGHLPPAWFSDLGVCDRQTLCRSYVVLARMRPDVWVEYVVGGFRFKWEPFFAFRHRMASLTTLMRPQEDPSPQICASTSGFVYLKYGLSAPTANKLASFGLKMHCDWPKRQISTWSR
ncbi:MAG: hypothetical protein JWP10_1457 [Nocardioidaceae bacterium]|nr:hypothetical protein [Nocardioidaceae bacterium]